MSKRNPKQELKKLQNRLKISKYNREFYPCLCRQGKHQPVLAVLHQTQGPTEEQAARYLKTRPDGSCHVLVDWDSAHRIAEDTDIVCGVGGANTGTWHLEMAGYSSWVKKVWMLPKNWLMIKRSAYYMAEFLSERRLGTDFYNARKLTRSTGLSHCRGWTTHAALSKSNKSTSTHTDPGKFFPRRLYQRKLKKYYKVLRSARA